MKGRWLALAVLSPLALACGACGTLLAVEPDPDGTPGIDGGGGGGGGGEGGDGASGEGSGDGASNDATPDACLSVDVTRDPKNCGTCGHACAPSEACVSSVCIVDTCTESGTIRGCGTTGGTLACVDVSSDDKNCGACAHECNFAGSCSGGQCARLVFVTTNQITVGNVGTVHSLDDADGVCQNAANAAGAKNTFRAWMSSSTANPQSRFTASAQPYRKKDGTVVANNFGGVTTPGLLLKSPIDIDASGIVIAAGRVWTGTRDDGQTQAGAHCDSWSQSASGTGNAGSTNATDSAWTEGLLQCSQPAHLYCFEQ